MVVQLNHIPPCLQGLSHGKGSQSTLGGKWGTTGGVELDELGRPVIWSDGEESLRGAEIDVEKEERNRRMKSNLKGSNMSLVCISVRKIKLKCSFVCNVTLFH